MNDLLAEIKEINLFYLLLAQKMLREDYSQGLFRLGLAPEVADALLALSHRQLMQLSDSSMLITRLRLDDAAVVRALSAKDEVGGALQRARMAIRLADQPVEGLS